MNETELDKLIEEIRKMINDYETIFNTNESELPKKIATYRNTMKSRTSSEVQKAVASLLIIDEYNAQGRRASNLSILSSLQSLAINVKILQRTLNNLNEQLAKSKIIEKIEDIEDIKELKKKLDRFTELLKSTHERRKKLEESREKDILYIV